MTAMATSHTRWAVVMSRNAGFVDQVRLMRGGGAGGADGDGGRAGWRVGLMTRGGCRVRWCDAALFGARRFCLCRVVG